MQKNSYLLTVSFISIGEGTDGKAIKKFLEFIESYETPRKTKLDKETTRWGREGEVDYCFKLSELSSAEQKKFITEIKLLLKDTKLVNIEENTHCKQKR